MFAIFKISLSLGLFSLIISCDHGHKKYYPGYVACDTTYLASPYSGELKLITVERGELVKKNQLLFKLDPNPQQLNIKQFANDLLQARQLGEDLKQPRRTPEINAIKAQIAEVNAQIQLAKIRVQRYTALYQKNAIDRDHLDEIVANYTQLIKLKEQYSANLVLAEDGSRINLIQAQMEAINSLTEKVNLAKWALSQKTMYAPDDGIIFDTYYNLGEFVAASKPVLSVLTPEHVYIEFFVPAAMLIQLRIKQQIYFNIENSAKRYSATINYISPEAEFVPPLVYSRENQDKIVFRIQAALNYGSKIVFNQFKPGQPITVIFHET